MRAKSIRAVEADPDSISQIEMKGRISDKRVYHIHGIYSGQSVQALSSIRFLKDPYVFVLRRYWETHWLRRAGLDFLPSKVFKLTEPIIIAGTWTLISIHFSETFWAFGIFRTFSLYTCETC